MEIQKLYTSGIKDTYTIFNALSKIKLRKFEYGRKYNNKFIILQQQRLLPLPVQYPLVEWILKNKGGYRYVYATGGQAGETAYVLQCLKLGFIFDMSSSLNKSNYPYSKATGLPFRKIMSKFSDCTLITDGEKDCEGAVIVGLKYIQVAPGQKVSNNFLET